MYPFKAWAVMDITFVIFDSGDQRSIKQPEPGWSAQRSR
jgi:hypothetical protein